MRGRDHDDAPDWIMFRACWEHVGRKNAFDVRAWSGEPVHLMNGGLRRNVALVTGAGQGVGLGVARALAEAGFKVVIADLDAVTAGAAAAELASGGHDAWALP